MQVLERVSYSGIRTKAKDQGIGIRMIEHGVPCVGIKQSEAWLGYLYWASGSGVRFRDLCWRA